MLDINVTVQGDRVIVNGLQQLANEIPQAIDRGVTKIAIGVERAAHEWLNGPGMPSQSVRAPGKGERTGFTKKSGETIHFSLLEGAGGYPVPVRSGWLRQNLDWLGPRQSRSARGFTFVTGAHEGMVYDSAEYARVIREGKGSSAKYGPRDYLTDGLRSFDAGGAMVATIEGEIAEVMPK